MGTVLTCEAVLIGGAALLYEAVLTCEAGLLCGVVLTCEVVLISGTELDLWGCTGLWGWLICEELLICGAV